MATVFSLQFLVVKSTVKILLDHEDRHSLELRKNAKLLIKQLSTQCFTAVSADILQTFVDQHPRLLTGELLEVLAAPHLTKLCLNQCTRILCHQSELKYVKNVMKKCNRLQHLELNGCHPPSETTTELCYMIGQHLNTLTSLSFEACKTLSNENVQTILLNCQNLSQLNLSMCPGITDQVFYVQQPCQQSIESTGSNVNSTTLDKQGRSLPGQHLSAVDISCNQKLTSTCIRHLVSLCGASLRALNVSCTGMDCTLLWYLCGYSWDDAVELASNLKCQNTRGSEISHLIREYQFELAIFSKQVASTKAIEDLQADDQSAVCQTMEEDGAVSQSKEDDDGAVSQTKEDGGAVSQTKEDGGAVSQSKEDDGAVPQSKEDGAVPQSKEDDGAVSQSKEDGGAVSQSKEDDGAVPQPKEDEAVPQLKEDDGTVPQSMEDGAVPQPNEDTAVSQSKEDDGAIPQSMEDGAVPQSKEDDGAVPQSKEDECVENGSMQHEVLDDKDILHIDNVLLTFNEFPCSLEDANAFPDSFGPSTDSAELSTDSVNTSPDHVNASPDNVSPSPDSVNSSPDNANASPDSVIPSPVDVSTSPDTSVISPLMSSDHAASNGQNSKMLLSVLSHHDESLDKLVSHFVENMLQQMVPSHRENNHNFYEGDNSVDILAHNKTDCELEFQGEFSKAPSNQASFKNFKAIPDQSSASAAAAPTISKDNPQTCQWTRHFIPNIRDLDISNIDFDDSLGEICLREFLKINKCLLRLNLSWKAIADDMLSSIQDSLSKLKWLSLSQCEKITSHGLAGLLNVCKNLTHLTIEGMYFITDIALHPLFQQDGRCGVQSLMLSETYITDNSLHRIAKHLGPKLTVLHLNWCEEISDAGLSAITAKCPGLTDFAIRQCTTSKCTLVQLADNCPNLMSLNVSSVDCLEDDIMITMATRLSLLNKLDISWNCDLTDATVCSLFINCPLLHDVCLDGLKHITSKPILPIIAELVRWRRCQALIKLKLKEQKLLKKLGEPQLSSDEEYEDLFIPTRSTTYALHLRYLSLQYCDMVNDRHLAEIVAICKGTLTIIDYYGEHIVPKLLDYR